MKNDLLRIGAAYIRVSDERQDEYSPDSQLKKIREYAGKEGYLIPEEYVYYDDGISGRSTKGRDEFKRMISEAVSKEHPFDKLYVWKLSRFSRSMEDSIIYKSMLEKKGVRVVSVSEPISNDIYGKLMERFLEWDAQFYSERLSEEVKRGMTEKVSRGEPTCAPPFGYVMKDGKYYPDEESGKADIVREVFEMYAGGAKQREIAIKLGEKGIRTKYGKFPDNRFVDYMLHNTCYIGKIRYSTDGSRSVSKRKLDNESIITADGHHKPLISIELWEKVQKMLDHQKKAYPKHARTCQPIDYMLKGLVRCSSCGSTLAMTAATSGKAKIPTLQCCNYARGACHTSHAVTMPKLESAFIDGLKKAIGTKQFTIVPVQKKSSKTNTPDFDKLIAVEERKLARAKEAYLAEIDTIEQYKKNKIEISERINDLKEKRDHYINEEINIEEFTNKVTKIVELIESPNITAAAKNEALRAIIEKAVYEKAKNNLAIYFHDLKS